MITLPGAVRSAVLGAVLTGALAGSGEREAHAEYLYQWSQTPSVVDTASAGDSSGRDILAAWHAFDGDNHYFRLDLAGAPSGYRHNNAGLYGIYVDSTTGGATERDSLLVPLALGGTDTIIASFFLPEFGGWFRNGVMTWNGNSFATGQPAATQQSMNGGRTLEWKVPAGVIGVGPFTWRAVTHDLGSAVTTYDSTEPVSQVPLPAAALLFGPGMAILAACRKRLHEH